MTTIAFIGLGAEPSARCCDVATCSSAPANATADWKRTFAAANGTTYQLEHHFHTIDDHHDACRQAGLKIKTVLEPPLSPEAAPHPNPVVLVIKAEKSSPHFQSPISNL